MNPDERHNLRTPPGVRFRDGILRIDNSALPPHRKPWFLLLYIAFPMAILAQRFTKEEPVTGKAKDVSHAHPIRQVAAGSDKVTVVGPAPPRITLPNDPTLGLIGMAADSNWATGIQVVQLGLPPKIPQQEAYISEAYTSAVSGATLAYGFRLGLFFDFINVIAINEVALTQDWGASFITQQQLPGTTLGSFGCCISLEGDVLVAGDPNGNLPNTPPNSGFAAIFVRNSGTFSLQQILGGEEVDNFFGVSSGISGNTIVVGASGHAGKGAVYIYERPPGSLNWALSKRVSAEDANFATALVSGASLGLGSSLGHSVAIDGDVIIAGAPLAEDAANLPRTGAAFLITRSGATWDVRKRLGSGLVQDAKLGWSVSIHGDTAVAGAPGERTSVLNSDVLPGAVHVYRRANDGWPRDQIVRASDGEDGDLFGSSVSLSSTVLAVAAPGKDIRQEDLPGGRLGKAYLYSEAPPHPPTVVCPGTRSVAATSSDGATVTLTAQVADPDGGFVTVDWYVDGSNVKTLIFSSAPGTPIDDTATLTRDFLPGNHIIRVSASDGTLTGECTTTLGVGSVVQPGVNHPPMVSCPDPVAAFAPTAAGIPVTLTAAAGDPDGNAITVTWNIDGVEVGTSTIPAGTPPTSAAVSVVRPLTPGTHAVKITGSDGSLFAECTTTATIILDPKLGGVGAQTNLDVRLSSRASQSSLDSLTAKVTALELTKLDTPVSTRASQAGLTELDVKVSALNTAKLDAPVSTRSSQASVDGLAAKLGSMGTQASMDGLAAKLGAIGTKVGSIDLSRLDTNVNSRASQSSVNGLEARLSQIAIDTDNQVDALTRLEIERELGTEVRCRIAAFYLPTRCGGRLEQVGEVVADDIQRFRDCGFDTSKSSDLLEQGSRSYRDQQFPAALSLYQRAYQALIAGTPVPPLEALRQEGQVTHSWPAAREDVQAQETRMLRGAETPWRDLSLEPASEGDQSILRIPSEDDLGFFRLRAR